MFRATKQSPVFRRLPRLAATAVIFWGLSTNTHLDAANTSVLHGDIKSSMPDTARETASPLPVHSQVLTPKDAELYRALFMAERQGDEAKAHAAIVALNDKRLLGHALAARYLHHQVSLDTLKGWMTSYGDHPEARELYIRASKLKGFETISFPASSVLTAWHGGGDFGGFNDFRGAENPSVTINPAALSTYKSSDLPEGTQSLSSHLVWRQGLAAWKRGDSVAAAPFFLRLANDPRFEGWDHTAAAYWAYRALKRSGHAEEAYSWLKEAARQPDTFYGLLALHLMGREPSAGAALPDLKRRDVELLESKPSGWRALALLQIGEYDLAEAELRHLPPSTPHMRQAMLALADRAGLAALTLSLGHHPSLGTNASVTSLYPIPPWQPASGFQVDRALLYALARSESQFDPRAISPQGACGLMQLMPATATQLGMRKVSHDDRVTMNGCQKPLLDPSVNLELGQNYVSHLEKQPGIGNNLFMVLAAYNSGPGKVSHWQDDKTRRDPLLFIETMPSRETRHYVQHVMMHYWMYSVQLGRPLGSLAQLAKGDWPRCVREAEHRNLTAEMAAVKPITVASARKAQ